MKVAVTSTGEGLEAEVDPRFGRCSHFVIVDTETMESTTISNSGTEASGGAGTAAGQVIAKEGAEALLTGHCGPNAFNVLEAAGIKVMSGVSGTVREAVEKYKAGEYTADTEPTAKGRHG